MQATTSTSKQTPRHAAQRIEFLLSGLTVYRNIATSEPANQLIRFCQSIIQGNAQQAIFDYHTLAAALTEIPARRVTGDIWKDFLFCEMFEKQNRFILLAAQNKIDPPLSNALKLDLERLEELFKLSSAMLLAWLQTAANGERTQEAKYHADKPDFDAAISKSVQDKDDVISKMALTAWGGGKELFEIKKLHSASETKAKSMKQASLNQAPARENKTAIDTKSFIGWGYDEPGKHEKYAADESLGEIYRKFLAEAGWGEHVGVLFDFYSQNGSEKFLKYKHFLATDRGIEGVADISAPDWDEIFCSGKQKEKVYANMLRFLHTSNGENTLLFGQEGMGKSTLIYSILRELSELRLVIMAQRNFDCALKAIEELFLQPLQFIVFFNDYEFMDKDIRRLKSLVATKSVHHNILIYATARKSTPGNSFFGQKLFFEPLDAADFNQIIADMLRKQRIYAQPEDIKAACEQWEQEGNSLNMMGASQITARFARQYRNNGS